jgi:FCP1-like phosphatase family protein
MAMEGDWETWELRAPSCWPPVLEGPTRGPSECADAALTCSTSSSVSTAAEATAWRGSTTPLSSSTTPLEDSTAANASVEAQNDSSWASEKAGRKETRSLNTEVVAFPFYVIMHWYAEDGGDVAAGSSVAELVRFSVEQPSRTDESVKVVLFETEHSGQGPVSTTNGQSGLVTRKGSGQEPMFRVGRAHLPSRVNGTLKHLAAQIPTDLEQKLASIMESESDKEQLSEVIRACAFSPARVEPGQVIGTVQYCTHSTVYRGICVNCQRDVSSEARAVPTVARPQSQESTTFSYGPSMGHGSSFRRVAWIEDSGSDILRSSRKFHIPVAYQNHQLSVSLRKAEELSEENARRLLRQRKLPLVLDLDHTLVHATNDPRAREILCVLSSTLHASLQLTGALSEWERILQDPSAPIAERLLRELTRMDSPNRVVSKVSADRADLNATEQSAATVDRLLQNLFQRLGIFAFAIGKDTSASRGCAPLDNTTDAKLVPFWRWWRTDPASLQQTNSSKGIGQTADANTSLYYIKLRPGLHEFLRTIADRFELHIYTMGSRPYADTVASIIDSDERLFQGRITSRDDFEDGRLNQKNLKHVFPCDDSMVLVVDDREDVWVAQDQSLHGRHFPNLIRARPYYFFRGLEETFQREQHTATTDILTNTHDHSDLSLIVDGDPAPSREGVLLSENSQNSPSSAVKSALWFLQQWIAADHQDHSHLRRLAEILAECHQRFFTLYDQYVASGIEQHPIAASELDPSTSVSKSDQLQSLSIEYPRQRLAEVAHERDVFEKGSRIQRLRRHSDSVTARYPDQCPLERRTLDGNVTEAVLQASAPQHEPTQERSSSDPAVNALSGSPLIASSKAEGSFLPGSYSTVADIHGYKARGGELLQRTGAAVNAKASNAYDGDSEPNMHTFPSYCDNQSPKDTSTELFLTKGPSKMPDEGGCAVYRGTSAGATQMMVWDRHEKRTKSGTDSPLSAETGMRMLPATFEVQEATGAARILHAEDANLAFTYDLGTGGAKDYPSSILGTDGGGEFADGNQASSVVVEARSLHVADSDGAEDENVDDDDDDDESAAIASPSPAPTVHDFTAAADVAEEERDPGLSFSTKGDLSEQSRTDGLGDTPTPITQRSWDSMVDRNTPAQVESGSTFLLISQALGGESCADGKIIRRSRRLLEQSLKRSNGESGKQSADSGSTAWATLGSAVGYTRTGRKRNLWASREMNTGGIALKDSVSERTSFTIDPNCEGEIGRYDKPTIADSSERQSVAPTKKTRNRFPERAREQRRSPSPATQLRQNLLRRTAALALAEGDEQNRITSGTLAESSTTQKPSPGSNPEHDGATRRPRRVLRPRCHPEATPESRSTPPVPPPSGGLDPVKRGKAYTVSASLPLWRPPASIKDILAELRRSVLTGCELCFTGVFAKHAGMAPEDHELWRLAVRFGAVCHREVLPQVSHLIADPQRGRDTLKTQTARAMNSVFIVKPTWLVCSAEDMRRANELEHLLDDGESASATFAGDSVAQRASGQDGSSISKLVNLEAYRAQMASLRAERLQHGLHAVSPASEAEEGREFAQEHVPWRTGHIPDSCDDGEAPCNNVAERDLSGASLGFPNHRQADALSPDAEDACDSLLERELEHCMCGDTRTDQGPQA